MSLALCNKILEIRSLCKGNAHGLTHRVARLLGPLLFTNLLTPAPLEIPMMAERKDMLVDCPKVARHTSLNAALGDPGEPRSCLNIDQKLSDHDSPQVLPSLAEFAHVLAKIGQTLASI